MVLTILNKKIISKEESIENIYEEFEFLGYPEQNYTCLIFFLLVGISQKYPKWVCIAFIVKNTLSNLYFFFLYF